MGPSETHNRHSPNRQQSGHLVWSLSQTVASAVTLSQTPTSNAKNVTMFKSAKTKNPTLVDFAVGCPSPNIRNNRKSNPSQLNQRCGAIDCRSLMVLVGTPLGGFFKMAARITA